jgi:hypothetical protein
VLNTYQQLFNLQPSQLSAIKPFILSALKDRESIILTAEITCERERNVREKERCVMRARERASERERKTRNRELILIHGATVSDVYTTKAKSASGPFNLPTTHLPTIPTITNMSQGEMEEAMAIYRERETLTFKKVNRTMGL